ncbi:hypothetical protein RO3G_16509 [Rhizopus delemar RA 99-880]|uniref:Uncharacterized protein n=1 Tax=Rhizopus delemar (strain RA 99-880 / ATCC MYA-4621 / FGSC 9543 / NRRL 43880) TaxID=246409 RepID=I1CTL8_RHIO9|nr:hypothetical protein RO3G_16509 [Rhizopus delemar RA 99-880]|eukprot:EIE91798.1 hypothetical protein RO3G_16509 [Rhizopus delemar RA 99-880]
MNVCVAVLKLNLNKFLIKRADGNTNPVVLNDMLEVLTTELENLVMTKKNDVYKLVEENFRTTFKPTHLESYPSEGQIAV